MGRWYLVRHGATDWNLDGRVQGHCDTPLSERGRAQAERLAGRLAGVALAAAYTSDLARCRATSEAIVGSRDVPLRPTASLREVAYGAWEGLTYDEVRARFPAEYAAWMRGSLDFQPPGGETARQVLARLERLRDEVAAAHDSGDDMLVVGHSGSLTALAVALMRLPPEAIWRFRVAPAALSVLTLHRRTATLDLWNDASHLEGLDAPR